jgi:hypothetical protein
MKLNTALGPLPPLVWIYGRFVSVLVGDIAADDCLEHFCWNIIIHFEVLDTLFIILLDKAW